MAQRTTHDAGDEKQRALSLAFTQIEKQYGKVAIMRLGESQAVDIPVIPSGSLALDAALGVGGLPRGRVIEIYGPERLCVNSAGDWGPSKPTAVPDLIVEMKRRGHGESLIRRVVYENPLTFFRQNERFRFNEPTDFEAASV